MALDLRPLTLAELLDRSFSTYKRHLWLFVGIMAVPAVIALLYAIGAQLFQFSQGPVTPGLAPAVVFARMAPMVIGAMAFLLVYMVVYAFALGATTVAVAHIYKDLPITVGDAYRQVRRHGGRLILLFIWVTLRLGGAWIGIAVLAAIVAGLSAVISPILSGIVFMISLLVAAVLVGYMAVRYGVAVPAAVLEDLTAGGALARSVELTEEHRGRVFLVLVCAMVITYATTALLQGPFMLGAFVAGPGTATALVLTVIGAVFGTIGGMFSGPIMIIGLAMIYYDLRIRKEALDLQMMLDSLDGRPAFPAQQG